MSAKISNIDSIGTYCRYRYRTDFEVLQENATPKRKSFAAIRSREDLSSSASWTLSRISANVLFHGSQRHKMKEDLYIQNKNVIPCSRNVVSLLLYAVMYINCFTFTRTHIRTSSPHQCHYHLHFYSKIAFSARSYLLCPVQ